MKTYLLTLFSIFSLFLSAQPSVSEVRESYRTAVDSEEKADAFFNSLKSVQQSNGTVLMAYKGAAYMLLARYEPLLKKKGQIKNGRAWIESYIKAHPNDIEARFVRLTIQQNLPKIAGYNQNIDEDKDFIKKKITSVNDAQLKKMLETLK
ncbi:hypothetical protein O2K51_10205 [Apibacter raozihei]|uniref:hypothetical protein n=1 Tax=Apibacter TaxID=1778601 RepID=UPI000FE3BA90|nr:MULTISPECIES: hypothetical protein [Apibacter]